MKTSLARFLKSKHFRMGLSLVLGALLIYLSLRDVNLDDVWDTLIHAQFHFVALALLCVALNILSKAIRWQVLVNSDSHVIGLGKIIVALMTGHTLNWFIPGRVGDLSRAYVIGGMGPGRSFVLGTVALEKVVDMVLYALLFISTLLIVPLPTWLRDSGYIYTLLAIMLALGVLVVARFPDWVISRFRELVGWLPDPLSTRMVRWVEGGLGSLKIIQQHLGVFRLIVWTLLIWATAILTNHLTSLALGIQIPWTAALVVLLVIQAGITVPSVPGRIGLFQYLCILSLALFGVDQATSLSYGILLQAIVLLPATFVTLIFFGIGGLDIQRIDILGISNRN